MCKLIGIVPMSVLVYGFSEFVNLASLEDCRPFINHFGLRANLAVRGRR